MNLTTISESTLRGVASRFVFPFCFLFYKHPLQPHEPAHSCMEREGSGQLSIQPLTHRTGYCSPIREQYSVMWYVAALKHPFNI